MKNELFGNSEQLDDTISRQAALDALGERPTVWTDDNDYALGMRNQYDMDRLAIETVPPAQPTDEEIQRMQDIEQAMLEKAYWFGKRDAQEWIPTSERLPKVREWVLCQCRAGIMDVLRLTEDGSWNKNYPHAEYMSGFVIAWMPLPTSYCPEGDKKHEG